MEKPSAPSAPASPGGIAAAAGGALAATGAFLAWAKLTSSFAGGDVFGIEVPGSTQTVEAAGTSHWTGVVALAAGAVVVAAGAGAVLLKEARARRTAAALALAGGTLAVAMAVLGFVQKKSIAEGAGFVGGSLDAATRVAERLGVEGYTLDIGAGVGLYVTAAGGLVALAGAAPAMRSERPGSPGTGLEPSPPSPG